MPLSESDLKRKVLAFLKQNYPDSWVYKTSDRWISGIPDLLIVENGRLYAIELKVGKNKATKLQQHTLNAIAVAGGISGVCRSVDDVKTLMKRRKES